MLLHPELFNAKSLENDSKLRFRLKTLLGTVCGYGGEVPLATREIADRLGVTTDRVRKLLIKLENENLVRYEGKTLFFEKHVFYPHHKSSSAPNPYVRNFKFFSTDEFFSEKRNVQRFVLYFVGYERVYMKKYHWTKIDSLCGPDGIFATIRCRKEILKVIEAAKKYLRLEIKGNSLLVTGIHTKWREMGVESSQGAELWIQKQLLDHNFCMEFVSRKAIWQYAKVMEDYYRRFGYEFSVKVFKEALRRIQDDPYRAQRILELTYKPEDKFVVTTENSELNEISAYLRRVMENVELDFAEQLTIDNYLLQEKRERVECDDAAAITTQISDNFETLHTMKSHWKVRFMKNPDWFVTNRKRIQHLPLMFIEITDLLKKYAADLRLQNIQAAAC